MSRLTKKDLAIYSGRMNGKTLFDKVYNKLGQIEDLEDELGCSLETLFNALKNGIDMDGDGTLIKPKLYYDDVYKQWKFKVCYTPTACGLYNVNDCLKEDLSE